MCGGAVSVSVAVSANGRQSQLTMVGDEPRTSSHLGHDLRALLRQGHSRQARAPPVLHRDPRCGPQQAARSQQALWFENIALTRASRQTAAEYSATDFCCH